MIQPDPLVAMIHPYCSRVEQPEIQGALFLAKNTFRMIMNKVSGLHKQKVRMLSIVKLCLYTSSDGKIWLLKRVDIPVAHKAR